MGDEMLDVQAVRDGRVTCHEPFNAECLLCNQMKLLEVTTLAKRAADMAEALAAERDTWKVAAEGCYQRLERAHNEADKYQLRALDAEAKLREQQAREPLVQETIALFRAWQRQSGAEAEQTLVFLIAANHKLADWKP